MIEIINTENNQPNPDAEKWANMEPNNTEEAEEQFDEAEAENLEKLDRAELDEYYALEEQDPSHAETKGQEPTSEDYEKFARNKFSELLDTLYNTQTNASIDDEQLINTNLTVTADLLTSTDSDKLTQSTDVFGDLIKKYNSMAEKSMQQGQERIAERNYRFANAAKHMKEQFRDYFSPVTPQAESDSTLPADVID